MRGPCGDKPDPSGLSDRGAVAFFQCVRAQSKLTLDQLDPARAPVFKHVVQAQACGQLETYTSAS